MNPNRTVFLIDDDRDDQDIFSLALSDVSDSYNCITADNGCKALQKLESDPLFIPDYIFIDLNMPVMDGKQLLVELKKMRYLDNIPLIIYSTSSSKKDIEDSRDLGATHYLTKPASINTITHILNDLFNKNDLPFLLGLKSGTGNH